MLVYDPAKDGVDAGVLCGEEPVGVVATDDRAAIRALDADCVLYMPARLRPRRRRRAPRVGHEHRDDARRALRRRAPARRRRSASARRRRVRARRRVDLRDGKQPRVHHRGASVRAAVAAAPRRVDRDRRVRRTCRGATRRTCSSSRWGSGSRSTRSTRAAPRTSLGEFGPSLALLAEAAGRPVDEWTGTGEVAAARQTTTLAAGELPAGYGRARSARRSSGRRGGVDVVRFTANWYCTDRRRAGVGPPADGMAGAGARRRAARRRSDVSRCRSRISGRSRPRTPRTGR